MTKLDKYLRKVSDPEVVAELQLEIYKGQEDNEIVTLHLGPESNDITFTELEEYTLEYYNDKYDNETTYGFDYKIIEK